VGSQRLFVASLVCVLVGAVGCAGQQAAGSGLVEGLNYVALGDSVAAAPGVPDPALPAGCHKSTNNYPAVLARQLHVKTFHDVTCSGATTADITGQAQQTDDGPVPPQIDALDANTALITITIGANDIELATDAKGCQVKSANPTPCTNEFIIGNVDRLSGRITAQVPAWSALIDQARAKAPHARFIVVGYGTFVRPGGCFPDQPVLPRDADYLQSKVDELDDRQQQLAAAKGIDYFDTRSLTRGHDICAAPGDRYFEGFVTTGTGVPLHPNAFGAAAVGNALAEYIGRSGHRG
jgi:lysophospholipase L1-like esterase